MVCQPRFCDESAAIAQGRCRSSAQADGWIQENTREAAELCPGPAPLAFRGFMGSRASAETLGRPITEEFITEQRGLPIC